MLPSSNKSPTVMSFLSINMSLTMELTSVGLRSIDGETPRRKLEDMPGYPDSQTVFKLMFTMDAFQEMR